MTENSSAGPVRDPAEEVHGHRQVEHPGDQVGNRRTLKAGQPPADHPVQHDVGRPAGGRGRRDSNAKVVAGRSRQYKNVNPDGGTRRTQHVEFRPGSREGDCQRAEKFQGDGKAQPDALNGDVEADVHQRDGSAQQERRPPLFPREAMERRPGGRQEHGRGHELPHGDHARRSERRKCVGSDAGSDLVADAAAGHGQQAAEHSGAGLS
jgi:hypothetical protein